MRDFNGSRRYPRTAITDIHMQLSGVSGTARQERVAELAKKYGRTERGIIETYRKREREVRQSVEATKQRAAQGNPL